MKTPAASFWAIVVSLAGLAGCAAFPNERRMAAIREDLDMARLNGELKTLQARVEGMETVQQRILTEMEALRAERGRPDASLRLAALEQAIKTVDAGREEDKKEILKFMQSLAAPPPAAGRRPVSPGPVTVSPTGEHVVQAGETLSKIAAAYQTTVDAIARANNMSGRDILRVGQKLVIPGAEGGKSRALPGREPR
ncbi:MAG: LysM peptidoglycan-binding domain-containing protein [Verrucomicrobiota bacterium]|nr:LysM peptidoglycan-binding domain-containing protein [Verrucomicrobiota bacterium]